MLHAPVGAAPALTLSSRSRTAICTPVQQMSCVARPRAVRPILASHFASTSTSGRFSGSPDATSSSRHPSFRSARSVQCPGLFGLGLPELAVIAGVAVLVFGPSKLPEVGKSLGKTLKSFQSAAKEFESELKSASEDDPIVPPAPPPAAPMQKEEAAKKAE